MRKRLGTVAGAMALAMAAGGAQAATLEASGAFVDYVVVGDSGELSSFGAEIDYADGVDVGAAELSFAFGVPLGAGEMASGGFDVTDAGGVLLEGSLASIGYGTDTAEVTFGDLSGSLAEAFGDAALLTVNFDDPLGENPFAGLVDGSTYLGAVTVSGLGGDAPAMPDVAPIPLPASGLTMLMGGALAGGVLSRRRRSRAR